MIILLTLLCYVIYIHLILYERIYKEEQRNYNKWLINRMKEFGYKFDEDGNLLGEEE